VDIVCLSHLRWDFVYQRPNHLMARAARDRRVFFVEEPVFTSVGPLSIEVERRGDVAVVVPHVPNGFGVETVDEALRGLIDRLFDREGIERPILWYYTPLALPWTRHLSRALTVYDSMDDLAGFAGAPPALTSLETELVDRADIVFTGGAQLHTRMARRHPAVYCFPSSVDFAHFRRARDIQVDPVDQANIGCPRIGYAGVIDERIDLSLIAGVADRRPEWQIVLIGPVAKIAPEAIPARPNIHRLGLKPYAELPAYFSGWDVGWMPFARNDATRYISPTKTPEYLAAGLPVVSTSIADVVDPYGRDGLVAIADDVDAAVAAVERAMASDTSAHRKRADSFLAHRSWDRTWAQMDALLTAAVRRIDGATKSSGTGASRHRPCRRAASSRAGGGSGSHGL
jgi:UDP-galactopyranose mutase